MDTELETFIRLRYFPIELSNEYFSSLPDEVFTGFHKAFRSFTYGKEAVTIEDKIKETIDLLELCFHTHKGIDIVEKDLLERCIYYHQNHRDYNNNGKIPTYE